MHDTRIFVVGRISTMGGNRIIEEISSALPWNGQHSCSTRRYGRNWTWQGASKGGGKRVGGIDGRIKSAIKTKLGNRNSARRLRLASARTKLSTCKSTRMIPGVHFPSQFRLDTSILPFFHHGPPPFTNTGGDPVNSFESPLLYPGTFD